MKSQEIVKEIKSHYKENEYHFIQPPIDSLVLTESKKQWGLLMDEVNSDLIFQMRAVNAINEEYNYKADNKVEVLLVYELLNLELDDESKNSLNSFDPHKELGLSLFLLNEAGIC